MVNNEKINYQVCGFGCSFFLLLPAPFTRFIVILKIPFLAVLNWFVPVSDILVVLEIWLVVVAVFMVLCGFLTLGLGLKVSIYLYTGPGQVNLTYCTDNPD